MASGSRACALRYQPGFSNSLSSRLISVIFIYGDDAGCVFLTVFAATGDVEVAAEGGIHFADFTYRENDGRRAHCSSLSSVANI